MDQWQGSTGSTCLDECHNNVSNVNPHGVGASPDHLNMSHPACLIFKLFHLHSLS